MLLLQMILLYQVIAVYFIAISGKFNAAKYMFGLTIVQLVFMIIRYVLRWA